MTKVLVRTRYSSPFFFDEKNLNEDTRKQWIETLKNGSNKEEVAKIIKALDDMAETKKCSGMFSTDDPTKRQSQYVTLLSMVEAGTNAGDTHVSFGNEFNYSQSTQGSVDAAAAGNLVNPAVMHAQVNDQMDVAVSEPVPPQVNDQMDVAVSDSVPPQVNDQMDEAVSDSVPPQVNDQMDVG